MRIRTKNVRGAPGPHPGPLHLYFAPSAYSWWPLFLQTVTEQAQITEGGANYGRPAHSRKGKKRKNCCNKHSKELQPPGLLATGRHAQHSVHSVATRALTDTAAPRKSRKCIQRTLRLWQEPCF